MRVLISAYACGPNRGSEPAVGWNVARQIARYHEAWLLTSRENDASIREAVGASGSERIHVIFLEPLGWTLDQRTRRRPFPLRFQVHYYLWQWRAYVKVRSLHRRVGFDVIHHVTLARYYTPSFLSLLPVPFVWGPVGGGESPPLRFWIGFGARGVLYEIVRSVVRTLGELDPFVRVTARRSAVTRATTAETAARLRAIGGHDIEILPTAGIADGEVTRGPSRPTASEPNGPRYFMTASRLLHWKGAHLALRAFAAAAIPDVSLRIVGVGPDRRRLERLSRSLGIQARVEFAGELSRDDVRNLLEGCIALLHPSLHDSSPLVCVEAMAAGTPVICLGIGGPAAHVDGTTGVVVPAEAPRETIRAMAAAMTRIATDEHLRSTLGANGRRRVRESFTWEERGRIVSQLYDEAVGRRRGGRG